MYWRDVELTIAILSDPFCFRDGIFPQIQSTFFVVEYVNTSVPILASSRVSFLKPSLN
jgi:hypothetical protein